MRGRVCAAALILLLTGPGSAAPAEAEQQSRSRPAVWMVGDSVTVYSEAALSSRLAEAVDGRVEIDAENGRNVVVLDDMVQDELARARPRTMVLALGANPASEWRRRDLRQVVDSIPAGIAIVLVTVYRHDAYGTRAVRQLLADYSHWMRAIADRRDNVCIAPWRGTVRQHATEYLIDGAHPNETGAAVLAGLVTDAVVECTTT